MRRIRLALRVVTFVALGMVGLPACESQEQRQKIEALAKQAAELQQENGRLKQALASLTKENDDLKLLLDAATKKPATAKK